MTGVIFSEVTTSSANYVLQETGKTIVVADHVTVTFGQLTITTDMSSSETLDDRKRIKVAAQKGQLKHIIELSSKFSDDEKLLSETLIWSCVWGHLNVVKWMVEHTAADVNYTGVIKAGYTWGEEVDVYHTPLTAACYHKHLDAVKYLVETSRINVNLSESRWGYTPLIRACLNASMLESIYLLSEVSNLDVNIATRDGHTALHYAVSSTKDSGQTQLHKACVKGDNNNNNNKHFFNLQVANSPSRLRFEANLYRESSECTEHSQDQTSQINTGKTVYVGNA